MTRPSLAGIEQRAEGGAERDWTADPPAGEPVLVAYTLATVPVLTAAIRDVLALHYAEPYAQGPDYCAECCHRYPCATVRALDLTDPEGDPT